MFRKCNAKSSSKPQWPKLININIYIGEWDVSRVKSNVLCRVHFTDHIVYPVFYVPCLTTVSLKIAYYTYTCITISLKYNTVRKLQRIKRLKFSIFSWTRKLLCSEKCLRFREKRELPPVGQVLTTLIKVVAVRRMHGRKRMCPFYFSLATLYVTGE